MEYESLFKAARKAGTALADVEPERLGRILQHAARLLRGHTPALLEANARDIEAMPASSPMLDRLRLTPERIGSIASDMEAVSHLRSPQGEELARWTRPNGMTIVKRRVPFGVVGMVCEARPNVTADIFALCVKIGRASCRATPASSKGAATPATPTRRSRRCCTKRSAPKASTKTPSRCSPRGTKPWGRC